MSKETGGPAFPQTVTSDRSRYEMETNHYWGISVRDYFAIHATDKDIDDLVSRKGLPRHECRWIYADLMLSERTK